MHRRRYRTSNVGFRLALCRLARQAICKGRKFRRACPSLTESERDGHTKDASHNRGALVQKLCCGFSVEGLQNPWPSYVRIRIALPLRLRKINRQPEKG